MESHSDQTNPRRRWLCVAYAFPPIRRSGTHRTLGFVRHLDEWGWDATVLTVEPGDEPTDGALLGEVPSATRIIRTPWTNLTRVAKRWVGSVPNSRRANGQKSAEPVGTSATCLNKLGLREGLTRLLQTPDSRVGWLVPAVRAGVRAARRSRVEVIFSTSPYGTAHLIAMAVAMWTRKPWVADFRDPWVDNPFREPSCSGLQWWDGFLETLVLRRATHVVCATPTMTARLIKRHPEISEKCSTILNGFDPARFKNIAPLRDQDLDACVFVHAGQFYGSRSPGPWLEALRSAGPPCANGRPIRLHLIGPTTYDGRLLTEVAKEANVESAVRVLGERSHAETLARIAGADGVLLPTASGAGAELQVPNKLFEYLALRRPILAATDPANPVRLILREARADTAIFDSESVPAIAAAMNRLATHGCFGTPDAWSRVGEFTRVHRARELLTIIERFATRRDRTEAIAARAPTSGAVRAADSYHAAIS